MFRLLRRMPFLKLLAIAQTALLARRHLQRLDANGRRRLAAADRFSPMPLRPLGALRRLQLPAEAD